MLKKFNERISQENAHRVCKGVLIINEQYIKGASYM